MTHNKPVKKKQNKSSVISRESDWFTVHASFFVDREGESRVFRIQTTEKDAAKDDGVIDLCEIRHFVQSLYPTHTYFRVRTTRGILLKRLELNGMSIEQFNAAKREAEQTSGGLGKYDEDLTRVFNDTSETGSTGPMVASFRGQRSKYLVVLSLFQQSHVYIQPLVSSISRSYYSVIPSLAADYTIRIYDHTSSDDRNALALYVTEAQELNEAQDFQLSISVPARAAITKNEQLLVFVAEDSERVIRGYCACELVRFRSEIGRTLRTLFEQKAGEARHLFGATEPGNLFEIQGLSVDPRRRGSRLGLALLYAALDFIKHPQSRIYFPVSHIVVNSASYVTKLTLVRYLGFKYYGANVFKNEHFIETLDSDRRGQFLQLMLGYTDHLLLLFHYFLNRRRFDKVYVLAKDYGSYKPLFHASVSLYQLFFLILYASRRLVRPDASLTLMLLKTQGLFVQIAQFLGLHIIVSTRTTDLELRRVTTFFTVNAKFLLACDRVADINLLAMSETIDEQDYGFLPHEGTPKVRGRHKLKRCSPHGYDILLRVCLDLLRFSDAYFGEQEVEPLTGHQRAVIWPTLFTVLANVTPDLTRIVNSEIPAMPQLTGMRDLLQPLATGALASSGPVGQFLTLVKPQIIRQTQRDGLLLFMSNTFYLLQTPEVLLFDTLLEFDDLLAMPFNLPTSPSTARSYTATTDTTTSSQSEEVGPLYPNNADERRAMIGEVLALIIDNKQNDNGLLVFRDQEFSSTALQQYFTNLVSYTPEESIYTYDTRTPQTQAIVTLPHSLLSTTLS